MENRINKFSNLFRDLLSTTSRSLKEVYVAQFKKQYPEYIDDLNYVFETLAGKHPIGWTFVPKEGNLIFKCEFQNIQEMIQVCEYCEKTRDMTKLIEMNVGKYGKFLAPIVNRTLRLGIGNSQLEKTLITPMLAKKYEGESLPSDVAVTEKLDGNRCIAAYIDGKWKFFSRSGKEMKVNFDMSRMNTAYIYDGEVMSKEQTKLSIARAFASLNEEQFKSFKSCTTKDAQLMFNKTSGAINSKYGDKSGLVYNIFDVISDKPYAERRELLLDDTGIIDAGDDIRGVPILYRGKDASVIVGLLSMITDMGGEGVMLNFVNKGYEHKRSSSLLKLKRVQRLDMRVMDITPGTGKYTGMVGALDCMIETENGDIIRCDVGSGLSDAQRIAWAISPGDIIGYVVEIGYHEKTQDRSMQGSKFYSLRFPRLLRVRKDKTDTSEF